ncbi:MAG: DUF4870 domain-containing protein [Candidatus Dojkabacteria bacterium]
MEKSKEAAPKAKSDDTLMAVLATLPLIGLIFYFAMSDASKFVRHYAKQSIGLLVLWVVAVALGFIPVLGWILSCLIGIGAFVGWILLVVNALQGNTFSLPVISDLLDQVLKE